MERREQLLVQRHANVHSGHVLSVGCGWNPGRHLFPQSAFRLVGVDADPNKAAGVLECGRADEAHVGYAGRLDLPSASFDVVLYRLVLHHIAYQGSLEPCFGEAARLLRPGGVLIAIEPGAWHPIGAALTLANRAGLAHAIHGTTDDIPLSPRALLSLARGARLTPELYAVTYAWRRLHPVAARLLYKLDARVSNPQLALLAHTVMLIARKPAPGRAVAAWPTG